MHNVRYENKFHFEEFEKSFFVFFVYCNFVIIITIPNMYRSLLSLVVHSNMEPKLLTCEKDLSQKLKYVDVFWEDTTLEFDV